MDVNAMRFIEEPEYVRRRLQERAFADPFTHDSGPKILTNIAAASGGISLGLSLNK